MYRKFGKRLFDFSLAALALILLSPLLLLSALLVKLDSRGPVFFTQERLGYHGRIFRILKFRSMTDKKRVVHKDMDEDDLEVTRVGAVLRRLKIDELPQLINILKGDMSIVGPRPWVPSLKEVLTGNKIRRLHVRPGLTGIAQTNGNVHLDWEDRMIYDLHYVDHVSFALDLRIIMKTFLIVFLGEEKFVNKAHE